MEPTPEAAPYVNPDPRQTLSYIRGLLQSRGLAPRHKLGQNFLIDLNLVDLIVNSAELTRDDLVLEVGSGTGSLTTRMADHAGAVLSVELDRDFHAMCKECFGWRPNIEFIHGDILENKNELNPEVLTHLDALAARHKTKRLKLVANLPYVVATPVMANLLIGERPIERMVVMIQWELAERMTSAVNTRDFGSLAVLFQSLAETETIRKLSPSAFWPRPEVDSAIVRITPKPEKRALVGDAKAYREFLRDLYTHRRKNLRQALAGWPLGRLEKTAVDAMLAELGFDGSARSEGLDLEAHRRLYEGFNRWGLERLRTKITGGQDGE